MEITDERFPSLWEEIREALVGIAGQISPARKWEWQVAIDKFLKDPLTAEDERNVQELLTWYTNDLEVKQSVEELKVATQGMSQRMERLETSLENKGNYLEVLAVVREQGQDFKDQLSEIHQAIDRLSSKAPGGQYNLTSLFIAFLSQFASYSFVTVVESSHCRARIGWFKLRCKRNTNARIISCELP